MVAGGGQMHFLACTWVLQRCRASCDRHSAGSAAAQPTACCGANLCREPATNLADNLLRDYEQRWWGAVKKVRWWPRRNQGPGGTAHPG